jgi:hypothetical protein
MNTFAGVISIRGSREALDELRTLAGSDVLRFSEPVSATSVGEALDAPLNLRKALATLALMTAIFQTADAGVTLADHMIDTVHKQPAVTLHIQDSDGRYIGSVDASSTKDDVQRWLTDAASTNEPGAK